MPQKFDPIPMRFRTKLACEIVDMDPLRLNEAIAAKDGYKCAPQTRAGRAREFGEFDLVSLFIFKFLTNLGYPQRLASMYACTVLDALKCSYETLPDRFDFPLNPFPDTCIARRADEPTTFVEHSGKLVSYATISFNINDLRAEMQERMNHFAERERSTFGND